MAVGPDGSVYLTDPAHHRILVVGPCESTARPFGCVSGPSREPGEVDTPRGVAVGSHGRLFVADAGNDRITVFDVSTAQVVGLLDGFDEPWDLAADGAGAIYVVEHGASTISRLDDGDAPDTSFSTTLAAQTVRPDDPGAIAVVVFDGDERLVVVDGPRLLCYSPDGTYDDVHTRAFSKTLAQALGTGASVGGLAAAGDRLYVGAPDGTILSFTLDGTFLGRSPDYRAGARALAVDDRGRLVVHPGGGQVVRMAEVGTAASGTFRIGPITCAQPAQLDVEWQRIHVDATTATGVRSACSH